VQIKPLKIKSVFLLEIQLLKNSKNESEYYETMKEEKFNPNDDIFDPSEEYFNNKDDKYENESEEYFPLETSRPPHY